MVRLRRELQRREKAIVLLVHPDDDDDDDDDIYNVVFKDPTSQRRLTHVCFRLKKQIEGQNRGREEVKLKIEEIEEKVLRRERYLKVDIDHGDEDDGVDVEDGGDDDDDYDDYDADDGEEDDVD